MSRFPFYIINTFTKGGLSGNPAGVCVLQQELSENFMQEIASKNNLPETAFIRKVDKDYSLRWFTPDFEIDLCGHGTMASAYVIFNYLEPDIHEVQFDTISGRLAVFKSGNLLKMSLPRRNPTPIQPTQEISDAIQLTEAELYSERDLYIILDSENAVKNYAPDYIKLAKLSDWLGIVVTAPGNSCDFVSRYFCPELQDEDPVTGSSHCTLTPLWSDKLGKSQLLARQLSPRGGELICELIDATVRICGYAITEYKGEMKI